MARPTKDRAIERLRKVLNEIPELKTLPSDSLDPMPLPPIYPPSTELLSDSPEFERWHRNAQVTLRNTFGDNSRQLNEFNNISFKPRRKRGTVSRLSPDFQVYVTPPPNPASAYMKGLDSAAALLKSMIEEIEDYWEDEKQTTTSSTRGKTQQDGNQTLKSSRAPRNAQPNSNKVFVIHGRDEGAKQTVARFLEKVRLKPVILHEQPNEGRTIIEKIEAHTQVGFAVVLLTPDDVGSLKNEERNSKPRARQNVIFEFGYFIGKLDRKRVCALVRDDVEKPSDYDGVLYIPLDDFGGWEKKLIKELKGAGFDVDANKAISS